MKSHLFHIKGMHCHSCVNLLERLPELDPNIRLSQVNFSQSTLKLDLFDDSLYPKAVQKIKELGFEPTLLKAQEQKDELFKKENRDLLARIGVAAACSGNIMLFAAAIYAGADKNWVPYFNWLSLLLFLPILFYSAVPFYKGFFQSIKYRNINIDTPITLALWSGFLLSVYNLFLGLENVYFDSTAGFVLLILTTRFFLKKIQQNFLITNSFKEFIPDQKILLWKEPQGFVGVEQSQIQSGDLVSLQRGQILPIDGILISSDATFDLSLLSGESLPKTFQKDMWVSAGSKLVQGTATLRAHGTTKDSRFASMVKTLDDLSNQKNESVNLADKISQILIVTVFAIAVIFVAFYSRINFLAALDRSLALLILACPCALAIGTPLAYGLGLRKAKRQGILIKSADVLDKVLKCENLFLDKTGTLTYGSLLLVKTEPSDITPELQKIILKLESQSHHPIAFALRRYWRHDVSYLPMTNILEKVGLGVQGTYGGHVYELKKIENNLSLYSICHLYEDGKMIATLYFADQLRNDSITTVRLLKKYFKNITLISGDSAEITRHVGTTCGLPPENCLGEKTPEDKLAVISQSPNSVMIGDGLNDALALQKASVGIAVKGSVDASLEYSNCYFLRGGISQMLELFKISYKTRKVIHVNLAFSLFYNLVGAYLALTGYVSPLLAAVLMPISSLVIISNTFWGLR